VQLTKVDKLTTNNRETKKAKGNQINLASSSGMIRPGTWSEKRLTVNLFLLKGVPSSRSYESARSVPAPPATRSSIAV
jgi:hypothetical protein